MEWHGSTFCCWEKIKCLKGYERKGYKVFLLQSNSKHVINFIFNEGSVEISCVSEISVNQKFFCEIGSLNSDPFFVCPSIDIILANISSSTAQILSKIKIQK